MAYCNQCRESLSKGAISCKNCGMKLTHLNKIESRSENRKLQNKIGKNRSEHLLPLLLSIAGVIILAATAIFYVYPKIMNDGKNPSKSVATKAVKEDEKVKNNVNETNKESQSKKNETNHTKDIEKEPDSKEYLLQESNSKKLTVGDIEKLTTNELRLARNEIYARHGMVFKSSDLNNYFSTKSWYSPNPSYNGILNEFEKYNINLIKAKEASNH